MGSARREFVAILSGLPANTKDIHLALLVKEHGAKAINIPLSLNSYKPKPWAYVTFNSQATMDAAMEQTIGFHGPHSSPTAHGRTPSNNQKGKDRSVSFSSSTRTPLPDPNSFSALEAAFNILDVLKNLQQDVARVESRISTLERNNQWLSAIEAHLGINPTSAPVVNSEPDRMEEDPPETTGTLIQHPNAPLSSGPMKSFSPKSASNKVSRSAPASTSNPSPQDELNSVIQDQK
ncbi:hypothetical protein RhiirA5_439954, partial [Rhizophagus irregularis]